MTKMTNYICRLNQILKQPINVSQKKLPKCNCLTVNSIKSQIQCKMKSILILKTVKTR